MIASINAEVHDFSSPFYLSDEEVIERLKDQADRMGLFDPQNIFIVAAERIELLASQRTSIA